MPGRARTSGWFAGRSERGASLPEVAVVVAIVGLVGANGWHALEAMRQERDAVAVVFSAPQGGADGSLSMDLMQSGARQGGGGSDPRGQTRQAGHPAPEAAGEVAADMPERQILSTDRVNIVT